MRKHVIALLLFVFSVSFTAVVDAAPKTQRKRIVVTKEEILPRFRVQQDGSITPDLRAEAAIVYAPDSNETLWGQNSDEVRPIASITKLMTALVFLDANVPLTNLVTITRADMLRASTTYLRIGDKVTVDDLLHLMLIASDNAAARALARATDSQFIAKMNAKAAELGLKFAVFADPAGLLPANVATATEVAMLLTSVAADEHLKTIMQMPSHVVRTEKGRKLSFKSTNRLLTDEKLSVHAGKTGYIGKSGFCLATLMTVNGHTVTIVVLGAKSNAGRFTEVRNIAHWVAIKNPAPTIVPELEEYQEPVGAFCGPYPEHVSPLGVQFIKQHEGFHPRAYRDVNGFAIGYGLHKWQGRAVTLSYPGHVTQAQADVEFERQLEFFGEVVKRSVCAPLQQASYDALVSVAFNLGRVNTSIIDSLMEAKAVTAKDFIATATVRGVPNWKLELRRLREFAMFGGDYLTAFNPIKKRTELSLVRKLLAPVAISIYSVAK